MEYISTIKLPGDETTYYVKDIDARNTVASKITDPATKVEGDILKYNGTTWVADTAPVTGVESVTKATNETVIDVDNTDSANPKLSSKITATQGNVTLSKETDGLKANIADSALTIAKTNGLQSALNEKELLSNKVTSISASSTDVQYPSAKIVYTTTENIRQVAEGKTKSFIIDEKDDITGTYDATTDSYTNVTAITGVTLSDLRLGDVVLIKEVNVADYWVSQITPSISLNKLETTKIDLTQYVSKAEAGDLAYKDSASGSYTPEGSVSTPTITVTPSTTTVNSITNVGSLPSWSASVTDEILDFSFNAGALPTKGENTTVATGISSATSSQPTFTGTATTITVQ